jgi:outer membrane biosynthesis protein TonB
VVYTAGMPWTARLLIMLVVPVGASCSQTRATLPFRPQTSASKAHNEAWYAKRHPRCSTLPPPEVPVHRISIDLAASKPASAAFPDPAEGARAAKSIDPQRTSLASCLQPGETLALKMDQANSAPQVQPLCSAARDDALACIRGRLGPLDVDGPVLLELTASTASTAATDSAASSRGPRSRESIIAVISQNSHTAVACYPDAVRAWPEIEGTMRAYIVVDPSGKVVATDIRNQTGNSAFACCVEHAVRAWVFPPIEGCGFSSFAVPFQFVNR